jgi:hypothetical protein
MSMVAPGKTVGLRLHWALPEASSNPAGAESFVASCNRRAYDSAMSLHYLEFDYSEDAHGHGSFDAMASASPAQLQALQAEVVRVLEWAGREFGPPAALDQGGRWDCELQGLRELATPLRVRHVPGATALDLQPGEPDPPRVTLTVTLTGPPEFCAALRAAFAID